MFPYFNYLKKKKKKRKEKASLWEGRRKVEYRCVYFFVDKKKKQSGLKRERLCVLQRVCERERTGNNSSWTYIYVVTYLAVEYIVWWEVISCLLWLFFLSTEKKRKKNRELLNLVISSLRWILPQWRLSHVSFFSESLVLTLSFRGPFKLEVN